MIEWLTVLVIIIASGLERIIGSTIRHYLTDKCGITDAILTLTNVNHLLVLVMELRIVLTSMGWRRIRLSV